MKIKDKKIILASQSPRRKELLLGLLDDFEIRVKLTDEKYPQNLSNYEIAKHISNVKADEFYNELKINEILIAADTIVCIDNTILEKPKTKEDAVFMLKKLSGKTHEVITGVTILSKNKKKSFYDKTLVQFYELTDKEISFYINKYKPFDKAGAYGIQEWIGYIGIKKIEGDYYNVMGLPLHLLYRELNNFIFEV